MRLTFCSNDASAAVIADLTWSVSLITRARSWPPRVRWKNTRGSACRCPKRRTRRSRTTFSWMATLVSAALQQRTDRRREHPLDDRAARRGERLLPEQSAQKRDEQHEGGPVEHRGDDGGGEVDDEQGSIRTEQLQQPSAATHLSAPLPLPHPPVHPPAACDRAA